MLYLIFDGHCGFCTACAYWLRRLDRRGRVVIIPCQQTGRVKSLGISPEACKQAAWALTEDGRAFSGAGAVWAAFAWSVGWPRLLHVYFVPGIRHVADYVYRWVAAHRHLLPGVTPYCESHPEACEP